MGIHITYFNNHHSLVFKTKTKAMRLEIQIQEVDKDSEPNWEAMGVERPKGNRKYKFRRCQIDTLDLEYIKEYTADKSILKCTWMEDAVVVLTGYDELVIRINDLENSYCEGEEGE